jgi:exoribonuclease II
MSEPFIPLNSLVLYRARPARVASSTGDKLTLELEGGETAKVRPKDVTLLHSGPLRALDELRAGRAAGDAQTAWELLSGNGTTLREVAELAYGSFTPASAWAAWQLVHEGVYFRAAGDGIRAATAEEVAHIQAQRAADNAEREAWDAFISRAKGGKVDPEQDRRYLREVEDLAYGRTERSRVLKSLAREESPENAHATLLEWGAWDENVDPYPTRAGVNLKVPDLPVQCDLASLLAQPDRVDLTHLAAFAVDDPSTETPDDAISWEEGPGLGKVWVHVADPAAFILPDDPIDLDARSRGVTLHLPQVTVPMLPPETTPLLGLGLNEFSPALSFGITVAESGEILDVEITPSITRVQRVSYEGATERLAEHPFARLAAIASAFGARRFAASAANIDLPEVQVRVKDGEILIEPVLTLPGRVVVENCMILAGEATARYALERNITVPHATQEGPDAPPERGETMSAMFALRRTMKRSQYRSVPSPHFGLGLSAYAQSTSPLRRYLDLVTHQQLRAHLAGRPLLPPSEILARIGEIEGPVAAARQAEGQSDKYWTLAYLRRQPKWRGRAVLLDRRGPNGIFILPELALETSTHLPGNLALDTEVTLQVRSVDLPRLDARFRIQD